MFSQIVQLATLGLGVAASPLPVVAVLIILLSKRAFPGSITLAVSWVLGIVIALGISVYFAATIKMPKVGTDLPSEGVFALLLGIGLVVMGLLSRRGRRKSPHASEPPAWINSVDHLSPFGAALVAFSNATTSPKNLALAITAGRVIADARFGGPSATMGAVVYIAIASLSVAAPVALFIIGGQRAVETLERWREKITANAAVFMEIVLFVLGIGMSVKGILNLIG